MVHLEEVEDEEFVTTEFKDVEDDDDYTDTDSELSDDEDLLPPESLGERLYALRDMIPPTTRRRLWRAASTTGSYVRSGLWLGGKGAWVVSTSVLLWGVPFALAVVEEQQIQDMEQEQKMREMGNEMMGSGGEAGAAL